jgi:hypothetical protein
VHLHYKIGETVFSCIFQVKLAIFILEDDGRKMLITVPKFNYCFIRRDSEKFIAIKYLLDNLAKNGNISSACPLNPGYLYLKNHFIEDKSLPMFVFNQDRSEYLIIVNVTDDNGKRPKRAFDASVYIKYLKKV